MTEMTEVTRTGGSSTDKIVVDEPPLPRRTRRPIDVLRLLLVLVAITALAALAVIAERTLTGLTADLAEFNRRFPSGPVKLVSFAAELASLILPPVLVFILLIRGRMRTTVELLIAGLLAAVTAGLFSTWLQGPAPERLHDTFVPTVGGLDATAIPAMPTLLVAIMTVVSILALKRIRRVAAFAIVGSFAVWLVQGDVTVGGMLLSLGLGRTVGLLIRLVSGQPSAAPNGHAIAAVLSRHGYDLSTLRADPVDKYRRYIAESSQGSIAVLVLDRDEDGAGVLTRAADQIRTREEILPRRMVTMRNAVNQIALQSLAVSGAGVRTPNLRNVLRIGPDAAAIVYDHVGGRVLASMQSHEVSDAVLEDLWQQLARLRRNEVAHRRISGRTILIADTGKVWLLDPSGGEVAAPDLAIRADLAQALVGCALIVGADRAITTAIRVLGRDVVSTAIPLLQPVALAGAARRDLKGRRDILAQLRDGLASSTGREPAEPVRLQRLRPLSLLTGVGAVFAVYLVGTQLSDVSVGQLWSQTDWRWLFIAVALMFCSFLGAAFALLGFVPERLPFWRVVGAQMSLGFLRLLAPSTVGNVAINIRLLTKAGVAAPLAAASVAANQVGNVAITFPLIGVLGALSGSSAAPDIDSSVDTLVIVIGVLLGAALLALIPPIRVRLRTMWSDFAERGLPRLLDVLGDPRKLMVALGGILMQSACLILCFYTCLKAVGGSANVAAMAVVQLVGNTLGMAVPTPGGLGAVEAALTAGVSTLSVSATTAVTAVLVFRIVSFWIPILPGWVLWTQMKKRDLL
jgi:uncharacterized membrane protein YbhN (UPF0104 family)/tRNA A-37 threonylcarbamoyl transferase component Bud32